MTDLIVTVFAIFAPIVALVIFGVINLRRQRRKNLNLSAQTPLPSETPYEPKEPAAPNAFLRHFPEPVRSYVREQWPTARFGFYVCVWLFTVMLCGSLLPAAVAEHRLPMHAQQVWYSYLTEIGIWYFAALGCAVIAAMITCFTLVMGSTAAFYRTRPIPLNSLFWVRVLPAVAALVCAAVVSIGISFIVLIVAYGPVWRNAPQAVAGSSQSVTLGTLDEERAQQSLQRRVKFLSENAAAPRMVSGITTMILGFSAMMVVMCQPFGAKRSGRKAVFPVGTVIGIVLYNLGKHMLSMPALRFLFYSGPMDPLHSWRYLPVPVMLAVLLLFAANQLYLRRDV